MDQATPSDPAALRAIPPVDRLLREVAADDLPRPLVTAVIREELERLRIELRQRVTHLGGNGESTLDARTRVELAIQRLRRSRIQRVINATGVLIHTNLGRSPLPPAAVEQLRQVAGYCNLEFDLEEGQRDRRGEYLERALAALCGSEAAAVVNNCAAALVLVLRHFASASERNRVIISRGELVQIGGGFRIPEILNSAGAALVEVGTTNQTTLADYARAISPEAAMILKVHRSNFYMSGFVDSPSTAALAELARKHKLPLVEDLGSGATDAITPLLSDATVADEVHEPTPQHVLAQGVDLVTFSGDKLFGGPQAGIIAGRRIMIDELRKNPLFRALRCDKLVLTALQATVDLHLNSGGGDEAGGGIALHAMLRMPLEQLRRRGESVVAALSGTAARVHVTESSSRLGGGSYPSATVPSVAIEVVPADRNVEGLARRLRLGSPPIVPYVADHACRLDLRTVSADDDEALVRGLRAALT